MYDVVVAFPRMKVGVRTREGRITDIVYLPPAAPVVPSKTSLGEKAARQLAAYLADPDTRFDLPLHIEGTPFQRRLWAALCGIPRGKTMKYGELARRLGAEARAVGQACGDNRLPVVIPCHRVVAANGIGGFAHATGGYLLEAKRWLLAHECGADAFELTP
jgi:methylated-DNA-[protein]-cysteine S-methyltransferase